VSRHDDLSAREWAAFVALAFLKFIALIFVGE